MIDVFEILKSKGYKVNSSLQSYYKNIDYWDQWWKNDVPKFHTYKATDINRNLMELTRKKLGMAKKVAEDWANLLLNDKTFIVVDDDASQLFLSGDKNSQAKGVFGESRFWINGNRLIEKEYALGTVAMLLVPSKPKLVSNSRSAKLTAESVEIKYIKDPRCIIPLSYDDTGVSECAFSSVEIDEGKEYMYLQIFSLLPDGRYRISNEHYLKNDGGYSLDPSKDQVKSFTLPAKPFFVMTPNLENNVDDVPLGVSVYANSIDQLESCDLTFDNFYNEFTLGKKKVFMSQDALSVTEIPLLNDDGTPILDANGIPKVQYIPLAGEAIEQSLYYSMGESFDGNNKFFEEYNPTIRVDENKQGLEFFLNLLSSKVGFGQGKYRFDMQTMSTATEVKASNKDLTESVYKQRIAIEETLIAMTKSILVIAKEICGQNVNPEANITIKFDDSMFSDEEAVRMRNLQEIRDGVMQKYEYRVKWYGEDDETAKSMIKEDVSPGLGF